MWLAGFSRSRWPLFFAFLLSLAGFSGGVLWLVLSRFVFPRLVSLRALARFVALLVLVVRLAFLCFVRRLAPFRGGWLLSCFRALWWRLLLLVVGRPCWALAWLSVACRSRFLLRLVGVCVLASWLGFSSVGFSGSRSLGGWAFSRCRGLASAASLSGASVLVGCARGADGAARLGAGSAARVFRVVGRGRSAFVARSCRFVRALAASPSPVLVSFPACVCPSSVRPASRWLSGGSGSWSSAALAAGLGVPVFVFLPAGVGPPSWWGSWSRVSSGALAGAWRFVPVAARQASLF